jgi:hypothetical protein
MELTTQQPLYSVLYIYISTVSCISISEETNISI